MNKLISSQVYNSVELLLAEKRTSLSVLRTGIAIFTLPLSVFTVLVATSNFYRISESLLFIIPLLAICVVLVIFGMYLIFRSFKRIKDIEHKIQEIKSSEECIKDIVVEV